MTRFGSMLAAAAALAVLSFSPAHAQEFVGRYSGFNEVGALNNESGSIFSDGKGLLELTLDKAAGTLTYKLTYSDLGSAVTQAHIHFGKPHVAGAIMVFFCSNLSSAPAGTQACPASAGTVTGTITATDVRPIPTQNVSAGDFEALVAALESHTAYGNIHTVNFPAGEIRADIERRERDHER